MGDNVLLLEVMDLCKNPPSSSGGLSSPIKGRLAGNAEQLDNRITPIPLARSLDRLQRN